MLLQVELTLPKLIHLDGGRAWVGFCSLSGIVDAPIYVDSPDALCVQQRTVDPLTQTVCVLGFVSFERLDLGSFMRYGGSYRNV